MHTQYLVITPSDFSEDKDKEEFTYYYNWIRDLCILGKDDGDSLHYRALWDFKYGLHSTFEAALSAAEQAGCKNFAVLALLSLDCLWFRIIGKAEFDRWNA